MQRYVVISTACIAVAALYFFSKEQPAEDLVTPNKKAVTEQTAKATEQPQAVVIKSDKPKVSTLSMQSDDDFYAVNKLSDKAEGVLKAAGVLPSDLNNEAYIEFDLPSLRELEAGDNFELMIPQTSETFIAEVTFIDLASNGDKSVFGTVTGADGRFHTTVLTVGENAVYGQFTAPSGNYVFESKDQYGWIAAKRDLYKKHIEFEHSEHEHHSDAQHSEHKSTDIFAPKLNKNDNKGTNEIIN